MTTEKLFSEKQHFKQLWLWAMLISIDGVFVYRLIKLTFLDKGYGEKPVIDSSLVIPTIIVLLLTLLFIFLRLDTVIRKDGVYYRYLPFQWSYKKIPWDNVSEAFVRRYNPIGEYGGWGLRIGIFGKGRAYNVSGNEGLQLIHNNGKKFLLGTQQPEEIEKVLKELKLRYKK